MSAPEVGRAGIKLTAPSVTFTVTNVTGTGLLYDASKHRDLTGNSTGPTITVRK